MTSPVGLSGKDKARYDRPPRERPIGVPERGGWCRDVLKNQASKVETAQKQRRLRLALGRMLIPLMRWPRVDAGLGCTGTFSTDVGLKSNTRPLASFPLGYLAKQDDSR